MIEIYSSLKRTLLRLLNKGHQRTVKARKHIIASFLIKGISILVGFLMVPITLGYISKEQYGIWLTLSSVVAWLTFFDVGLGHGLRNKLAVALAEDDLGMAKVYVSTTYAILLVIFTVLLLVFFLVNPFLNWTKILNTSSGQVEELRLVATIAFSFFCISFVLRLIHTIFLAKQQPALSGLINMISNLLSLIIIIILTKTTEGSLVNLAFTLGVTPLIILILASLFFYSRTYRSLTPSLRHVKSKYIKDLSGLGVKFFLVGISGLVIFSTDHMIIIQLYGPSEVPAYGVAHKYFHQITVIFSFITVPFWSAYTEAYVKKDMDWILSTNRSLIKVWRYLAVGGILLLLISGPFYRFWVPEIEVPLILSIFMCVYVVVLAWGNIFVVFINGVGKVRLQLIYSIIGALINIPLSYLFAKTLGLGTAGVIVASIVSVGYGLIIAPIQFKKITSGTAKGIWNQ